MEANIVKKLVALHISGFLLPENCAIDVKMDGSILEKKSSFIILG